MNNEQELDQKSIDELLAAANKELSESDIPPTSEITEDQQPSITETSTTSESTENVIQPRKKIFTKKVVSVIIILFTSVSTIGGILGYKMADHAIASRSPLEKLIQQGITFEEKNFVAYAGRGDKDIVTAFLEAGMPVNVVRDTDGWSPLIAASFYKKTEIVKLLLERQATVNLQDKYGKTALMEASAMGAEDIVLMLIEYGANPNVQDNNGRTALMEAYFKKHAKIAETLKSLGALPTIQANDIAKAPPAPHSLPKEELPPSPLSSATSDETRLSMNKAGSIQIGMPLEDIQKKYPNLTITGKYIDGLKKTIATIYLKDPSTPSLQLELSSGKLKLISTISVYDEQFSTDKQITIHSTVGDIRNQYTINDIKVINSSLFLVVKSIKMLFELDLNKGSIPTEWLNTGNPNSIPPDTKIKRIIIY
ncbi:ankyrin repeat domain-containing protein [Pelosinus sp. sgz500959]|uniref:ankyrin repeat domain-containing protein n=1 Tax=Pelosinus sp. sgz500959 TaxID=3242472 RepID=UPI00366BC202